VEIFSTQYVTRIISSKYNSTLVGSHFSKALFS
jgi:hypothetical protein